MNFIIHHEFLTANKTFIVWYMRGDQPRQVTQIKRVENRHEDCQRERHPIRVETICKELKVITTMDRTGF